MNRIHPNRLALVAATLVACLVAPTHATAGARYSQHPGYVDGAAFVEFAGSTGDLVEVTLHGRLLNLITQRAIRRHDEELGRVLEGLVSINAVITEFDDANEGNARQVERAKELVHRLGRRLTTDGWDRFVRVRQGGAEDIFAYAHLSRNDEIDGLVVMGMTDEDELMFVNLAGEIDMDAVAVLGDRFDFPGLDGLPPGDEIRDEHRKRKTAVHEHVHIEEEG